MYSDREIIMDGAIRCYGWAEKNMYPDSDKMWREERNRAMNYVEDALDEDVIQRILEYEVPNDKLGQFGHDLYLSVAGHGAGFGDGDWDDILTQASIEKILEVTSKHHFV